MMSRRDARHAMMHILQRKSARIVRSAKHSAFLSILIIALSHTHASAGIEAAQTLDKIVARVGEYPILLSELLSQAQVVAMQRGFRATDSAQVRAFHEEVLRGLINDRLYLTAAKEDTTILVGEDEINQELDRQIADIKSRFPDDAAFLGALAEENLTLRELRRRFYPDVQSRLMKQRFMSRKMASITVSRREVDEFFEKYRDSIPSQPAAARIAHTLLTFTPSKTTEDSVRQLAESARRDALKASDFTALAIARGGVGSGDLGYIRYNEVTPEFARAAFALGVGDISGVVRTANGFHVIKVTARNADSVRLSQILYPVLPASADSLLLLHLADSLIHAARGGASFAEIAKVYSADNDTRRTEGELGWFDYAQLPPEFQGWITDSVKVGDIIGPISSTYGIHIVKILETQKAEDITLDNHYDDIREMSRRHKAEEKLGKWIEEQKSKTSIQIFPI